MLRIDPSSLQLLLFALGGFSKPTCGTMQSESIKQIVPTAQKPNPPFFYRWIDPTDQKTFD
jgi:hypothetical protein